MDMTTYTDEADKAITAAQRTVEPGDLVTHEDDIGGILGRVFALEGHMVSVLWSHSGKCVPVAADRVHFLERPEAFVAVSYRGEDGITGEMVEYCFVSEGPVDAVRKDIATYEKLPTYIIVASRLGEDTPE